MGLRSAIKKVFSFGRKPKLQDIDLVDADISLKKGIAKFYDEVRSLLHIWL